MKNETKSKSFTELLNRFGVSDMFSLRHLYSRLEQPLFRSGRWNYNDSRQVMNKIKIAMENLPDEEFKDSDLMWEREILWYWNHHAISIAISRGNIRLARIFADNAISFQGRNHPNKITRLLWHLVHGRIRQARRWSREGVKRPERGTARAVIRWYEQGYFSSKQVKPRGKYEKDCSCYMAID